MQFHRVLILYFTFTVLLALYPVSSEEKDYFYPNDKNCGQTEEIPGDARTLTPWTVAIFVQKNVHSPYRYFLTGNIGGPTTVMTTFRGSYGHPTFQKGNKTYHIHSPNRFLVVAGISSTDLNARDEFSQTVNVSYILPYNGNLTDDEYHMVMFRLETPFNFDTPYVKSICQPYGVVPFLRAFGYKGRYSDVLSFSSSIEPSFISGFNVPINEVGPQMITRLYSNTYNDNGCLNTYKYYYRSQPDELFCVTIDPAQEVTDSTCMSHGSLNAFKPRAITITRNKFFDPEPRFYSNSIVSLIPRRDLGQCNIHTVYIAQSMFTSSLDWVKLNMICNSTTYPCHDGKCVPLDQVCDGKIDCSSGEDEDPVYCKATNRCEESDAYICGLEGKCIRGAEVGDGVKHCPSGSDEDPEVIKAKRIRQNSLLRTR